MRTESKTPDTFILSKGHGAMAQYVVLEGRGVIDPSELNRMCQADGRFGGHPDYGLPGIEISSGSLGHGLPIALGMARADVELGEDRIIYVVMSDGELMEGSVWEALLVAPSLALTNVIVMIDHNKSISRGEIPVNHPNLLPVAPKLAAFGWEVAEADGHDESAIRKAVESRTGVRPFALVAHTTKGKGVSYMENKPIWAYRSPNKQEYEIALQELADPAGSK